MATWRQGTVTALVAGGHTEQLPFHLKLAKENGLTEAELVEVITFAKDVFRGK